MTELETVEGAGGLAILEDRQEPYDLVMKAMRGEVDLLESYDSEEVQRALALGLLGSESVEEVFGSQDLKPWSELLTMPVEVRDVHFNPSKTDKNKGPGFYCVVRLVNLETGEQETRHVGGWRTTAQLLYAWSRGLIPLKCKLTEIGAAQQGQNAPLGLVLLD